MNQTNQTNQIDRSAKLISPRVFHKRLEEKIGDPPSLRTIYRLIDEGKIRSVRLSAGIIRIPEGEVARFLDSDQPQK